MRRDAIPVEYAEESIRTLSILVKALRALLINRQCVDPASLEQTIQKNATMMTDHIYLSIPCICASCGRKGFDRLGEGTKCMFCGQELRFNIKDDQVDAVLAHLDSSRLFGFTLKATDITNDETFTSVASKSFTAPCTYYVHTKRGSRFKSIDSDRVSQNGNILKAQNKVAAHQRQISRICKEMLSVWEVISNINPKAGSNVLKSFLTIDEDKLRHSYDALYTPSICRKCQTEQWPGVLFSAQCFECAEPLPVTLHPGLLVMQKEGVITLALFRTKERKAEYMYTLFEALFQCAEAAFGLTLDDLTQAIPKKIEEPVVDID